MQAALYTKHNNDILQFLLQNSRIEEAGEHVMAFLNEVQLNCPDAVSPASGRPEERFFGIENLDNYFNTYIKSESAKGSRHRVLGLPGQYSHAGEEEWQTLRTTVAGEIFEAVILLGGSITVEHGVEAVHRAAFISIAGAEYNNCCRQIKPEFDPGNILNNKLS